MSQIQYTRPIGLSSLVLTQLFERMSFYGFRAIIIMFMVNSLGIKIEEATSFINFYLSYLFLLIPIPAGILSDRFLGYKKGVILGGVISLIGILLIFFETSMITYLSVSMVWIGTGITRVNLAVLLGRLYDKADRRRNIGFTIYLLGINVGTFLGTVVISMIYDVGGWLAGFGAVALAIILGLGVFLLQKDKLVEIEKEGDLWEKKIKEIGEKKETLEIKKGTLLPPLKSSYILLAIMVCLTTFFSAFMRLLEIIQNVEMDERVLAYLIGVGRMFYNESMYISIMAIIAFLGVLLFWRIRGAGKTISYLIIAFLLVSVGAGGVALMMQLGGMGMPLIIFGSLGVLLISGLGEAFLSSIALSFVTRIAPIRYAATWVGLYLGIPGILTILLWWVSMDKIYESIEDYSQYNYAATMNLTIYAILLPALIITIALFLFRNRWKTQAGDIE